MWYVYLLECKDGSLYTGITNRVEIRMEAHRSGKGSKYVAHRGFGQLLYTIQAKSKVDAAKTEYKIKKLRRNDKIDFFLQSPMLEYSILKNK